jgi:hypothetical protein
MGAIMSKPFDTTACSNEFHEWIDAERRTRFEKVKTRFDALADPSDTKAMLEVARELQAEVLELGHVHAVIRECYEMLERCK